MSNEDTPTVPESPMAPVPFSTDADATVRVEDRGVARPKSIGPYKILETLGEGGMGVVYLAQQTEPVKRRVALKVIKLGMDTKQVLARFEQERQALAMMDHPNVAKVFDAGVTDAASGSRPYFVMEHVAGTAITDHCDRQRLSLKDRLNIFRQVCSAVQHAHQKGIIHRDLKPSNIIVDASGSPRVIDFGVAKATSQKLTENTLFTEQGQLIGTPEYMSPEQAEMTAQDIDTRSDIYSLGVILYELLTGALPFEPSTLRRHALAEIQRIIREEEPPRPSTRLSSMGVGASAAQAKHPHPNPLPERERGSSAAVIAKSRRHDTRSLTRHLRGDLDWIVMKCLEKDRNRRYETANGLAADIERHLKNEPVAAGPPSAAYKMSKFVRRNRTGVIAGGMVAATLVGAVVVSIFFALGEQKQRGLAEEREQEAQNQRDIAEKERDNAKAINDFLNNDLLAAVAPAAKQGSGKDVLMREVLDVASEKIEEQSQPGGKFAERPLIEASIRATLGVTYRKLGEYPVAEPHLERARELRLRELGKEHPSTLDSMNNLAALYWSQGRYEGAEPLYREALESRKRILGPEHPSTLDSMNNLAVLYLEQGRYEEAESLYMEALESRKRILDPEHPDTLRSLNNLALLYYNQGRYEEAEPLYLEALEIMKRILGPEHPDTLGSMANLAILYKNQGRYEKAEPLQKETLKIMKRILGPEHPNTLVSMNNLAVLYKNQGRYEKAEPLYLETLETRKRILGPEHPDTLGSMANLALLYSVQGRYEEAEPLHKETLEIMKRILGPEHPNTLMSMNNLALLYYNQGRYEEAEPLEAEALEIGNRILGPEHPATNQMRNILITLLTKQGRIEEAGPLVAEQIEIGRRKAEQPGATANDLNSIAWTLLTVEPADLRDPPAALTYALRACELTQYKDPGILDTLALAYLLTGDPAQAVATEQKALALLPPDAPGRSDYEAALDRYQKAFTELLQ